jgi:transcriptional regulator with XRE-family HTH domain
MQIGAKLKAARAQAGLTQEQVAEKILVSRQSISNWENERNFPDIISVIRLGELYGVSLDTLLKGDEAMIRHLDESTNVVKSNKKLLIAVLINLLLMAALFVMMTASSVNEILLFVVLTLVLISTGIVFYQIIRKI